MYESIFLVREISISIAHLFQKLPIVEISIGPSDDQSTKAMYPNMSINNTLISSLETADTSLLDMMNDNPIDPSVDEDDEDESLFNFNWIKQLLIEEQHILEYSLEYGFLRLPPETRKRLNIEVLLVTLGTFDARILLLKANVSLFFCLN